VNRQQLTVHREVREKLLAIAQTAGSAFDVDVAASAATALLTLDPFDEAAILALADCLSQSGRRVAAKQIVLDFMKRLERDLEMAPSPEFHSAARRLGTINSSLTVAHGD
jgi:DNA-binding SARP family transcriptional activator